MKRTNLISSNTYEDNCQREKNTSQFSKINLRVKLFYNILTLAVILGFVACDSQLHELPIGIITEQTVPTNSSVVYSVKNSYQLLSSTLNIIGEWGWDDGTVMRNDFVLQDIASGDMMKKWSSDGDQAWMDRFSDFSITPVNAGVKGQWSYDYAGVARANLSIGYLTDLELCKKIALDEASRKYLLGQVYFLRAFYYFDLINNYGDVPLVLEPIKSFSDASKLAKRETKANVTVQINKDLTDALALIPDGKYSDNTEKWRVSKGAVLAMQAKVALYNQQWATVLSTVNTLESLNYYSLNTNYFDCFDQTKKFAENEDIFQANHASLTTPASGNGLCALMGWGFVAPTTNFINSFEANDPRLSYTVETSKKQVNKLLGTLNGTNLGNDDASSNKIYIRWADVLLWKAEAALESGDNATAVAYINKVRQRARNTVTVAGTLPAVGTLPDRTASTDKATIKNWLVSERRAELGFESHRFNDLKRWGIAKTFLNSIGSNYQDKNNVYPIPQTEVDRTGGSIAQNPEY